MSSASYDLLITSMASVIGHKFIEIRKCWTWKPKKTFTLKREKKPKHWFLKNFFFFEKKISKKVHWIQKNGKLGNILTKNEQRF